MKALRDFHNAGRSLPESLLMPFDNIWSAQIYADQTQINIKRNGVTLFNVILSSDGECGFAAVKNEVASYDHIQWIDDDLSAEELKEVIPALWLEGMEKVIATASVNV